EHTAALQIERPKPVPNEQGCELKAASAAVIEQGGEDGGRFELRQAHEVDRSVHADQSDRAQIADDPVVLYRLIAHATKGYRRVGPGLSTALSARDGRGRR